MRVADTADALVERSLTATVGTVRDVSWLRPEVVRVSSTGRRALTNSRRLRSAPTRGSSAAGWRASRLRGTPRSPDGRRACIGADCEPSTSAGRAGSPSDGRSGSSIASKACRSATRSEESSRLGQCASPARSSDSMEKSRGAAPRTAELHARSSHVDGRRYRRAAYSVQTLDRRAQRRSAHLARGRRPGRSAHRGPSARWGLASRDRWASTVADLGLTDAPSSSASTASSGLDFRRAGSGRTDRASRSSRRPPSGDAELSVHRPRYRRARACGHGRCRQEATSDVGADARCSRSNITRCAADKCGLARLALRIAMSQLELPSPRSGVTSEHTDGRRLMPVSHPRRRRRIDVQTSAKHSRSALPSTRSQVYCDDRARPAGCATLGSRASTPSEREVLPARCWLDADRGAPDDSGESWRSTRALRGSLRAQRDPSAAAADSHGPDQLPRSDGSSRRDRARRSATRGSPQGAIAVVDLCCRRRLEATDAWHDRSLEVDARSRLDDEHDWGHRGLATLAQYAAPAIVGTVDVATTAEQPAWDSSRHRSSMPARMSRLASYSQPASSHDGDNGGARLGTTV